MAISRRAIGGFTRQRARWTPAKEVVAKEMRSAGATYEQIAEVVGLSPQTVGLKMSGKRYSTPDKTGLILHHHEQRFMASDAALEAAAKRAEARAERDEFELFHGNVTAVFFGDPPPGLSAKHGKVGMT